MPGESDLRLGRVVRGEGLAVEPLYPAARLIKGAVLDAERAAAEGVRIVEEARAEAARILAAAHERAETVRSDAAESGARQAAERFAAMVAEAEVQVAVLGAKFDRDLPLVALALARRVLEAEFAVRPERIVDLVRTSLGAARTAERLVVYLHPADVAVVREAQGSLAREAPYASELRFAADPDLPPHGIRVETEMGSYIGGLSERLARLESRLVESLASKEAT